MSSPAPEIFKAYDIRGIVGKTLTRSIVEKVGRALGSIAQEQGQNSIIIARDGRLSGPEFANALTKGILSCGCDVIDIGPVPTGLLYYATHKLETQSGVMVTGSHNPPDYNGLKMVIAGQALAGKEIQAIADRIESSDYKTGNGDYRQVSIVDQYLKEVTSKIKLSRPLKIVTDCGNGIAGNLAPTLFRRLGCEVIELFSKVDGNFPNHHPDPSQPDNLHDLIETVKQTKADIGLGFDGDGDRVGVVAPNGTIIWPDRQMILFSRDVLSRNPAATIIFDVKCSQLLPLEIEKAGGKALMWRTGHSLIKKKMRETGALLGGEMSGHIFFKEDWYGFDDGLYGGARLLEIVSRENDIQYLFDQLPDSINTPEIQIQCEKEGEQHRLIEKLVSAAHFPAAKVNNIDGIRVDYDYGFGLARASNTTPTVVIRFEGKDQASIEKIQTEFRTLLSRCSPNMGLPF